MPNQYSCYFCHRMTQEVQTRMISEVINEERITRAAIFCIGCFNPNYTCCEYCGVGERTPSHNIEGHYYCAFCFNRLTCTYCGRFDENTRGDSGSCACSICYPRYLFCCERCGYNYRREDRSIVGICLQCYEDIVAEEEEENYDDNREEIEDSGNCTTPIYSKTFKNNPSKRLVGFELEFFYNKTPHALTNWGRLHTDGSLSHPTLIPAEFSSQPCNGDKLFEIVDKSTAIIKEHGGEVNNTCGFHIHLDTSDFNSIEKENIQNWWCYLEKIFFAFVPENRRNRTYCKSITKTWTKNHRQYHWRSDRYVALNISADSKWGTYEIRLHQGTLNPIKIKSWISLFLSFFEVFSQIKFTTYRQTKLNKMNERELLIFFFQQLKFPISLQKHFIMRIKRYGEIINIKKGSKPTNIPEILSSREIIQNAFSSPENRISNEIRPLVETEQPLWFSEWFTCEENNQ